MTRPRFDQKKIPAKVALDTTVVLRALGFAADPTGLCEELLRELIACRVEIQLPAPVLAEILRGDIRRMPQVRSGFTVAAFDELAAIRCAELFPKEMLSAGDKDGAALKYDAMIVACAVRWGAKHIVSLDEKLRKKATPAGVVGMEPANYLGDDLFNAPLTLKKPSP